MAITEEDKEKIQRDDLKKKLRICEESISKAEKYERLKDNSDWQGFLDDLKIVGDLHEKEIELGKSMLIDAPNTGYLKMGTQGKQEYVPSRQDWVDFIVRHQIQKAECDSWMKEADHICAMASMSRKMIQTLKDKLLEMEHVSGDSSENGKS